MQDRCTREVTCSRESLLSDRSMVTKDSKFSPVCILSSLLAASCIACCKADSTCQKPPRSVQGHRDAESCSQHFIPRTRGHQHTTAVQLMHPQQLAARDVGYPQGDCKPYCEPCPQPRAVFFSELITRWTAHFPVAICAALGKFACSYPRYVWSEKGGRGAGAGTRKGGGDPSAPHICIIMARQNSRRFQP